MCMSDTDRSTVPTVADDAARLAFIYQEAVRGLQHQQFVVESLNSRGGNLIFATAFATSLLGTRGLSDGVAVWDWIAVSLLLLVGTFIVFILWPYYNLTFRFDPEELLENFVDRDSPATMSEMHRALALRIKADMVNNWRVIQRIRFTLQLSLIVLLLEIVAWLVSIGVASGT
jgi:hypothetical protein